MSIGRGAWLAIAGAVVVGIGTVLAWEVAIAEFGIPARPGIVRTDGQLLVGLAIVGAVVPLITPRALGSAVAAVAGAAAIAVGLLALSNLTAEVSRLNSAMADSIGGDGVALGPGLYVSIAGAVVLFLGGLVAVRDALLRATPVERTEPT